MLAALCFSSNGSKIQNLEIENTNLTQKISNNSEIIIKSVPLCKRKPFGLGVLRKIVIQNKNPFESKYLIISKKKVT